MKGTPPLADFWLAVAWRIAADALELEKGRKPTEHEVRNLLANTGKQVIINDRTTPGNVRV